MLESRESIEILLVAGDVHLAGDLERRLIALDYRVCGIFSSIEVALRKIEATPPDLVLMDVDVSAETCGMAADVITKRWHTPVVFITAGFGDEKTERKRIVHPFGFIFKPFQNRELNATLETAIFLGKLDRERGQAEFALKESEEKYGALIANMMDGLLQTSPDGRVFSANQAACEMLGMTEDEIIGGGRGAVVDADDPRLYAAMEERARTGKFKGELNFKRKDGSIFPVELSSSLYTDKSGNRRTSMVFRDVTARKQVEDALRETERQYRELIQKAPAAILEFDYRSQCFTTVNEAMCHMTGYCREDLLAFSPLDLIEKQDWPRFLNNMVNRLSGVEVERNIEYKIRKKDGRIIDAILDVEVIADGGGKPGSAMVVGYDVTARKQAEEEREKLIVSLEKALAEVKTLRGFIPICANCKKIRDDEGFWHKIESYIQERSDVQFSHGICPECIKELYPDYAEGF